LLSWFQQKALSAVEAELERANTDLRITKEARKADQILWKIDRAHGQRFILSGTTAGSENEFHQSYFWSDISGGSTSFQEALLREQVRILEIEQKNLIQKKDTQAATSEILEAGAARLEQAVHLNELQRLTRKYRLSSIIDQLQFVSDPIRRNGKSELDGTPDGMRYIINQLIAIRDEDAQTIVL
ncbi:hypothetical protein GCK32_018904, partial [Trichostrongylus colubriformis]